MSDRHIMVSKRLVVGSLGLAAFGVAALVYAGPPQEVEFYKDPQQFEERLLELGKVSKGKWDFAATNSQAPGGFIFDDPPDVNNPGPFDSVPLDNITIQSNLSPQGIGGPNPRGPDGLVLINAPAFGLDNTAVGATIFVDSMDIISGPPAGDNHTAMALDIVDLLGASSVFISVYSKDNDVLPLASGGRAAARAHRVQILHHGSD